jgi:hypothetical protein
MKILIACEESQTVCKAMRERGYEAYSCDIQECSGGKPEWHIKGDAIAEAYSGKYDMMIAHPPCTFLSNAGAVHLYGGGKFNEERYKKGLEAKEFFMKLFNAPIEKICVENPIPSKVYELPKYTQIIQPYEYGHSYKKKTCLWLKNLPLLIPTNITAERQSTKIAGNWYNKGGKDRQKNRSKTFEGIAAAMAEQWLAKS